MKAKERILKTAIDKKLIAFNRIIMKASRQWKEIFNSLTKKKTTTTTVKQFFTRENDPSKAKKEKNRCIGLHQNYNDTCVCIVVLKAIKRKVVGLPMWHCKCHQYPQNRPKGKVLAF